MAATQQPRNLTRISEIVQVAVRHGFGYAFDRVMPYVTGGVAWGHAGGQFLILGGGRWSDAALAQMAAFYKERKMSAKAAAVYEKLLAMFPDDPENPARYLELGRVYREAGLYDLAVSRFYSVLNAAISRNAEPTAATNASTTSLGVSNFASSCIAKPQAVTRVDKTRP